MSVVFPEVMKKAHLREPTIVEDVKRRFVFGNGVSGDLSARWARCDDFADAAVFAPSGRSRRSSEAGGFQHHDAAPKN